MAQRPRHGDAAGETTEPTVPRQTDPSTESENASLHILRIASDVYPEVTGGGAIHAHSMSKHQTEMGHEVTVLTSDHGDSEKPSVEERDGYTVVRDHEFARPFGNSITPGTITSLRRRLDDVDVIHAHSHLYFTTNTAAAVARLTDVPLVVTNHGLVSQTAPRWLQSLFIPTVARFTFNSADRVLCYTETDRDRLRQREVDAPISVINNGIDCAKFTPATDVTERNRLLFVGRLMEAKGLQFLLEAFTHLREKWPRLELDVVGDGPRRDRYEVRCVELGVDDHVSFLGEVPYAEMETYYQRSRAFVLPSLNEGLPRTILEAQACETPVVTTALPQLEPVVDGAGYMVPKRSVMELVDAIDRLLNDKSRRREMGRAGRRQVVSDYSWAETVERTTAVYHELIDGAGS